jgi:hypothetical protein
LTFSFLEPTCYITTTAVTGAEWSSCRMTVKPLLSLYCSNPIFIWAKAAVDRNNAIVDPIATSLIGYSSPLSGCWVRGRLDVNLRICPHRCKKALSRTAQRDGIGPGMPCGCVSRPAARQRTPSVPLCFSPAGEPHPPACASRGRSSNPWENKFPSYPPPE